MGVSQSLTLALLCSGDLAPGMNALVRAVVRLGKNRHRARVLGVRYGFEGLREAGDRLSAEEVTQSDLWCEVTCPASGSIDSGTPRCMMEMDHRSVSGIIAKGGVVLGLAAPSGKWSRAAAHQYILNILRCFKVDVLVVAGNRSAMAEAAALDRLAGGQPHLIGVPATIHNDCLATERSLGLATALQTIVDRARELTDSAAAKNQVVVLEIPGRRSGCLAAAAGDAVGAAAVVVPEQGPLAEGHMLEIANHVGAAARRGHTHAVILVAEGAVLAADANRPVAPTLTRVLRARLARVNVGGIVRRVDVVHRRLELSPDGRSPLAADVRLANDLAETLWSTVTSGPARSGILVHVGGRIRLRPLGAGPLARRRKQVKHLCRRAWDNSRFPSDQAAGAATGTGQPGPSEWCGFDDFWSSAGPNSRPAADRRPKHLSAGP